jgi:hypothetical protein
MGRKVCGVQLAVFSKTNRTIKEIASRSWQYSVFGFDKGCDDLSTMRCGSQSLGAALADACAARYRQQLSHGVRLKA